VAGEEQLDECVRQARFWPCPRCGRVGALVGHGLLVGYGEDGGFPVVRGRRFLCSNRHRQRGCGRTFSVLLDSVLRGFVVRALTLFELVVAIVSGLSIAAAWRSAAASRFSPTSGYRLWRRLRLWQPHLRARLARVAPAPACASTEPWAQLLAHLRQQPGTQPLAAFQLRFQLDLFG
jgi:hypothetical protein